MHTIDPEKAHDERQKRLYQMILDYQPSEEELLTLEMCKLDTVKEIEIKFRASKVNGQYIFPRKTPEFLTAARNKQK
jgi:hypothetical protein